VSRSSSSRTRHSLRSPARDERGWS
jgi:hypothetical protein